MTSRDSRTSDFIGRQKELVHLTAALDDALAGRGRLVMLAGEPGIGKTRLAQELATLASAKGAKVLWGWCYEREGAPPYWPWLQAIRGYVDETDPERLRQEMGPGASDISEILPELLTKLVVLEPPPALEPEQARFRLFDSIATFLKNAAQGNPLLLVLDDLHWADKPSLLLLEFLARQVGEFRILVVGCYRDVELSRQHPLSETLGQLARGAGFQRELLRGLSHDDTGRFIETAAGIKPPDELVAAVYAHTEGNPFFMAEVIRLLSEQGDLASEAAGQRWDIQIPAGVREVIGNRLNLLSEQCNQALTTASIIGREFEFKTLAALSEGITESQLLEAIDEALATHLLEETPHRTEGYQFSHALIQQTLAEELTTSRRVRLHGRIAEALETLYGNDAESHAAELAYHFAEAQSVLGTEKLVRYSLLAGERALVAFAWEEASALFRRGLEAKEGQSQDGESAALLFGLGRAQVAALPRHRSYEAVNTMRPAFDYYVATNDIPRALAIAEYPFSTSTLRGSTGITSLLSEAQTLVPPDSLQGARLLARYGDALNSERGDDEGAIKALVQAQVIAQRENDVELEGYILARAARIHWSQLHPQEALENSLSGIELAGRVDDARIDMGGSPHWEALVALVALGNIGGARPHAVALLARAKNRGGAALVQALHANSVLAQLEGDWETARNFSEQGLTVDQTDARLLDNRAMLEYQLGEFDQGDAYLERLLESMRLSQPGPILEYSAVPLVIGVAAQMTGRISRLDVAKAAAETVLSSPFVVPLFAQFARIGLALLAVQQGDTGVAEEQYAALKSRPSYITPIDLICPDRVLGILARTVGDMDQAANHFEDALAFCRKAGYRPELAWTCYDYTDMLLERNAEGDRTKAMALLVESLAISTELGMRPLMERVNALQEQAEAQPARAPTYPDGITAREIEVLLLICAGKTDREIGEDLFISVNTVGNHVRSILNKTDSANRAEAATYAGRHGLVSADDSTSD